MAKHRNRVSRRRLLTTTAMITLGAAALAPATAQANPTRDPSPAPTRYPTPAPALSSASMTSSASNASNASATSTAPAASVSAYGNQSPVRALEQAAHPLRSTGPGRNTADLRALSAMIGNAKVVGLGEATHGSHEFFTMKERLFRHLVEEKASPPSPWN